MHIIGGSRKGKVARKDAKYVSAEGFKVVYYNTCFLLLRSLNLCVKKE